ncbi:MAG: hypothetical protein CBB72_000695 [Muricauda sp. TMED12]|nr:MAG: hypothetical protein CBB72_000695 [Muricauda sp. TMED12]
MRNCFKIIWVGLLAGLASELFLGALFMSSPVQSVLYDPDYQSKLFLEVTLQRNMAISIIGLIMLSVVHSWLFSLLSPSMPGGNWKQKGLFWGFTIWVMYWVFQEWFIYYTLLGEPIPLAILELTILLVGSIVEGLLISKFLYIQKQSKP